MSNFQTMLSLLWNLLNHNFTLYGFTFSFWDIFIFSSVASLIVYVAHFFLGRGE